MRRPLIALVTAALALNLAACLSPRNETLDHFTDRVCPGGSNDAWPDNEGHVHVACDVRGGVYVWPGVQPPEPLPVPKE